MKDFIQEEVTRALIQTDKSEQTVYALQTQKTFAICRNNSGQAQAQAQAKPSSCSPLAVR